MRNLHSPRPAGHALFTLPVRAAPRTYDRPSPTPATPAGSPSPTLLLLAGVEGRAGEVDNLLAHDLARTGSWWATATGLAADAARLAGNWWESDRCSFLDVTIAVAEIQRGLRRLEVSQGRGTVAAHGRILLSTGPDAQHTFGLVLVAERLRHAGWLIDWGWPYQAPDRRLLQQVDAVGLSVSGPRDHGWVVAELGIIEACRPDLTVVVGGGRRRRVAPEPPNRPPRRGGRRYPGPSFHALRRVESLAELLGRPRQRDSRGSGGAEALRGGIRLRRPGGREGPDAGPVECRRLPHGDPETMAGHFSIRRPHP